MKAQVTTPAERRYDAIRAALRRGDPMLADAIENDERCRDCDGYVLGGVTVDPDK